MAVEQYRTVLPLTDRFVAAAVDAGIPLNPDYNGAQQEGVSYSQNSRKKRFRASTAQRVSCPGDEPPEPARRNQCRWRSD